MNDAAPAVRELMPAAWRRPLVLIWLYLLPQLLLLLLNLRSHHLAAGELSAAQRHLVLLFAAYGLALPLANLGLWAAIRRRAAGLDWRFALLLLPLHIGYLWLTVAWLDRMMPRTVAFWMLPPERVLYHQFALVMPAVFHAALLLACFPTRLRAGRDLGAAGLVLLVVPATWYVVLHLGFRARRLGLDVPEVVVFLLMALSTLVLTAALLRVLTAGWQAIRRAGGHGRLVVVALVGVAGPLGGLWLNAHLPFPVDFQSLAVYVMAALNGLVLLLPGAGPRPWHRAVWLLQCAFFPFTLYFFVVFLPFLPLALLAVLAMGAGFLMLVPTALCLIHLASLRDGWRAARASGAGARLLAGALLATLLLPGVFALRAALDRHALRAALDYLYEPKASETAYRSSRDALGRSLRNLRDFKSGLQLPFLTEFYSHVVFGGLVLPESRMQEMHNAFFGCDLAPPRENRLGNPLMGARRNLNVWGRVRRAAPLPHDVDLTGTRTEVLEDGDARRLRVTVDLANRGPEGSEYVADIAVPPGVLLSGFALKVGEEMTPGRLFEKKTALWVYEMIRDQTRRDPGLLVYRAPGVVELRVFPFAAGETRTLQLEFLYPRGFGSPIRIGATVVQPPPESRAQPVVGVAVEGGARLWLLAPEAWEEQRAVRRTPYLHVILDRSAASTGAPAVAWAEVEAAARQVGAAAAVVTLANYEIEQLGGAPVPLPDAERLAREGRLPARGGFCRDRAVRSALAWWQANRSDELPVILVVSSSERDPTPDDGLGFLASAWPGLEGYLLLTPGAGLRALDWAGGEREVASPGEWFRVEAGGVAHWIPADSDRVVAVWDRGDTAEPAVASAGYRAGVSTWALSHARNRSPGDAGISLRAVVESARASGVLVPEASYIVVENSAQWRFLEQSEKKKLAQNSALEFRDAPEPAAWLLLALFAAGHRLLFRARRHA